MLWLGFAMTKKDSRIEVRKTCQAREQVCFAFFLQPWEVQGDDSSEEPVQGAVLFPWSPGRGVLERWRYRRQVGPLLLTAACDAWQRSVIQTRVNTRLCRG